MTFWKVSLHDGECLIGENQIDTIGLSRHEQVCLMREVSLETEPN